jgi:hypothetical protein
MSQHTFTDLKKFEVEAETYTMYRMDDLKSGRYCYRLGLDDSTPTSEDGCDIEEMSIEQAAHVMQLLFGVYVALPLTITINEEEEEEEVNCPKCNRRGYATAAECGCAGIPHKSRLRGKS